jgi:hypothetical protein
MAPETGFHSATTIYQAEFCASAETIGGCRKPRDFGAGRIVTTLSARVRPWRQLAGQRAAHTMTTALGHGQRFTSKPCGSETKNSTRRSMPGPQSNSLHSNKPKQLRKHRRKCHNEQLQSTRHHFWIGYHDLCGRTRRASALCGCSRFFRWSQRTWTGLQLAFITSFPPSPTYRQDPTCGLVPWPWEL